MGTQTLLPTSAADVDGAQAVHAVDPAPDAKVSRGQGAQAVAPL